MKVGEAVVTDLRVAKVIQRGRRLEYFTIGWNVLEAVAALVAGYMAGSVVLTGFGLDSAIETSSGLVVLWRLFSGDRRERIALRLVGICFLALGLYIALEAVVSLSRREAPETSSPGILIALLSIIMMPLLARAKRRAATDLNSPAMAADARQTDLCAYLSGILLIGLVLYAALGWWWADPVAGILMVPIILKEGVSALRGTPCGCDEACH